MLRAQGFCRSLELIVYLATLPLERLPFLLRVAMQIKLLTIRLNCVPFYLFERNESKSATAIRPLYSA
jgi:hypothetical protein